MDNEMLQTVLQGFSTLALLAGAAWAVFRISVERTYAPQIEFTIEANFSKVSDGSRAAEYVLVFNNRGKTRVQVNKIKFRVLGIGAGEKVGYREKQQSALEFPHRIVPTIENIVPKKFGYIFVEPGVRQEFRYVSIVPSNIDLLLIHAEFNYVGNGDPHTAEKMTRVPDASSASLKHVKDEPALAAS